MDIRIGQGIDFHRFGGPGPAVVGGVEIPNAQGLIGHSDADVLVHSIMDGILGAFGKPDIGHHFPPDDEKWRGVSSLELLEIVYTLHMEPGWRIVNIDSTIVCEAPRMAPHIAAMKSLIASRIEIDPSRVGIKATTSEGLGSLGRGEGIMALANVLVMHAEG